MQPEDEKVCYVSGSRQNLDSHHIFGGPYRKWSEKYGLKVWLRHDIHMDLHDRDNELKRRLQREAQEIFEKTHTREEFMKIFGRNYL